MSLKLGLQVYSVRESFAEDFWGTLEAVSKIGYKYIEFANHIADEDPVCGFHISAKELRNGLDNLGLQAISNHIHPFEKVDIDKIIEAAQIMGNKYIAHPMRFFESGDDALGFAEYLNKVGEKVKSADMKLFYHNHYQEFQKFDGKAVLDIIVDNTEPDNLSIELDTFWTLRGGIDPITYLNRLGNRCTLIHQKDLAASANPVNLFDNYPEGKKIDRDVFMNQGAKPTDFTESLEGTMDIRGIVDTAEKIGSAEYIIIEQDRSTRGELESIELSYNNMSEILN